MTAPTHDDAAADLSRALAAMLHRDARPPCADGTGRWLAEDAELRDAAAQECAGCELLAPCAEAGAAETWGVWGGQDVSTRPSRRRAGRAHDAGQPVEVTT